MGIMAIMLSGIPSYAYAGNEMQQLITSVTVGLFVTLVVFLILREFFCWYWKINLRVALLNEIRDSLKNDLEKEEKETAALPQNQENAEQSKSQQENIMTAPV